MPIIQITSKDVHAVLSGLDAKKAHGSDGVPPVVLKNCASELTPCLGKLFRLCLSTNTFPSSWKFALIQPVPKKGDRSLPSNYRPIALTSTISKTLESIINKKILKYFSTYNLLSDRQYGFLKGRSTGDLLTCLSHTWSTSFLEYGETFAVALDISKAFDRVWHSALAAKLQAFGLYPSLCSFIMNFLSDRSIAVVADGRCSSSRNINSGVPQGSVLSPLLFLIFINDLLECTSSPIHSYADDSTLHYSTRFDRRPAQDDLQRSRTDVQLRMTSDLSVISEWGMQNLVSFNASKTQSLHITTRRIVTPLTVRFGDSELSPSSSLDILGISFSPDLSWKDHIISLAKSASRKLGVLTRFRRFFTPPQFYSLYRGQIRPCMEYCSHVWGGSPHVALLDKIERRALRIINAPALTSSCQPLSVRRDVASLSLFYRYYHQHCSTELHLCVPPPLRRARDTRLASTSHEFSLQLSNPRLRIVGGSFFYRTGRLWNDLPSYVFPPSYDLGTFKRLVSGHLLHSFG